MKALSSLLVFTDLDGTLLDHNTYSCAPALPALRALQSKKVPIVFCSSKTRAEQEFHREELGILDPFIVENGGAIFIPRHYFTFPFEYHKTLDNFLVIEMGTSYEKIRQLLVSIRKKGSFHFKGFGDMSAEEIAADTGLDMAAARRAKEREYSETVKFNEGFNEAEKVLDAVKKAGLSYTHGGRYYSATGSSDKGRAAIVLIDLFRQEMGQINSIGIGDSLNDLSLLSVVETPILVQKVNEKWENMNLAHLHRVPGIGPAGWNRAIQQILQARP